MTTLHVHNDTADETQVYITLGATPGCLQDVTQLVFSGGELLTELNPLQGYITLPGRGRTEVSAPEGFGLNGNIAFGTPPLNCPTDELPNGVNLAEFIINNGFQPGGQETIDISCVAGANVGMSMAVSEGDWTTNGGTIIVRHIENMPWDENTGRIGVFPYGCDDCTASVSPPECVGQQPQYVQPAPICNVQRPAAANDGGAVVVALFEVYAA